MTWYLLQRIFDFPHVKVVNGNPNNDVARKETIKGEQEQHNGVDEGASCQHKEHHRKHRQDCPRHFHILPVDHRKHWDVSVWV